MQETATYQTHGATGDTRMDAHSRDVDVDATICVQHRHGTAREAAIVHMRADGEIERAAMLHRNVDKGTKRAGKRIETSEVLAFLPASGGRADGIDR